MEWLTTMEDLHQALERNAGGKVIILKHSTQCPISAAAYREVEKFETEGHGTPVYGIRVIEERPLSNAFAEHFGIRHESPQAVVLDGGRPVWHASHWKVTSDALAAAVESARTEES